MLDKAKVRAWLTDTSGYDILDPKFFEEMGLSAEAIKRLTRRHSSDPELGKDAAHRADGHPGDVEGIAEFSAIHAVAAELGISGLPIPFYGRGKNFDTQRGIVLRWLKEQR